MQKSSAGHLIGTAERNPLEECGRRGREARP